MTTQDRKIVEHLQHGAKSSNRLVTSGGEFIIVPDEPIDPVDPVNPGDGEGPTDPVIPGDGVTPPVEEVVGDAPLQSFDHAIIRYKWTNISGQDLDTRTYFQEPNRTNAIVGWSRLRNDGEYLLWNQDNTGSGVESVLVDIQKMIAAYPEQTNLKLILRAWWYRSCHNGNVTIEFSSYKGGTMVRQGYDWKNEGGQAVQILTVDTNTRVQMSSGSQAGEHLATLDYNPIDNTGRLTKVGNDSNPDMTPPTADDIEPTPTPITPDAAGFVFNVNNGSHESSNSAISIALDGVTSQWALFDDGVAIASNSYSSDDVEVTTSRQNVYIRVTNAINTIKNYKLVAAATTMTLYAGTGQPAEVVTRSVEVLSFSQSIKSHSFNTYTTALKVPQELPTHVKSMEQMFFSANTFNQDISGWDVSNVTNMKYAFQGCHTFNQDIGGWDVSNVTNMERMFSDAIVFNRDIGNWNVSNVTTFVGMFTGCLNFNYDLNDWDISNATSLYLMFYNSNYNGDISEWDVSNVTNMNSMFSGCANFNQNIGGWITTKLMHVNSMFAGCANFNQPIGNWSMGLVTNTSDMFNGATVFNQDISEWDMSKVMYFENMFKNATAFNQNISKWNTMSAEEMGAMFYNAASFNQDLSGWCVPSINSYDFEEFSVGALSWGLPRPSFRSCPRGEVNGNVYVPPEPIPAGLDFSIYQRYRGPQVQFYLTMDDVTKPWKLMHGSRVICEHSAEPNTRGLHYRDGTFYREDIANRVLIRLPFSYTLTQYRLITESDNILFTSSMRDKYETDPVLDVRIINFSDNITSYKFNIIDSLLHLPDVIPPTVTSMFGMFRGTRFISGDISNWDVSNVTNMEYAFAGCTDFNQDISGWDVSNVTNFYRTFTGATAFNQDLSGWCVPSFDIEPALFSTSCSNWTLPKPVWGTCPGIDDELPVPYPTNTNQFIFGIQRFENKPTKLTTVLMVEGYSTPWSIKNYLTGAVLASNTVPSTDSSTLKFDYYSGKLRITITHDHYEKRVYELNTNGRVLEFDSSSPTVDSNPTSIVNVYSFSNVINKYLFDLDGLFTVPNYLPPNVVNTDRMFDSCSYFGSDISNWNVSNVTTMMYMFTYAYRFDSDLTNWNVSNVTDMSGMFNYALGFNGNISSWDVSKVTNMSYMFKEARGFNKDISNWNVSGVINMSEMFYNSHVFNQNIGQWNVSNVTNMSRLFNNAYDFNQDIGGWNVSNVTNMDYMFYNTDDFNQDLSGWCVSKITNSSSFKNKSVFKDYNLPVWGTCPVNGLGIKITSTDTNDGNTPLTLQFKNVTGYWSIKSDNVIVADTNYVSSDVTVNIDNTDVNVTFNQLRGQSKTYAIRVAADLLVVGDVSYDTLPGTRSVEVSSFYSKIKQYQFKVNDDKLLVLAAPSKLMKSMENMFAGCLNFNSDISGWDTSNVTNMAGMFQNCVTFNQDLSKWNMSSVTTMQNMFKDAVSFNSDISNWNTSLVTNMSNLFNNCTLFNVDVTKWNTAMVTDMSYLFSNCILFNQDIGGWNVNNVTNMENMFAGCLNFNQDIREWNTFKVTDMSDMFNGCETFNQSLGNWQVGRVSNMVNMFNNCMLFNQDLSTWMVNNILAEPSGFATNASDWTLPKPVWGRVQQNGLIFRTSNVYKPDVEMPLVIRFEGTVGGFELIDLNTGVIVLTDMGVPDNITGIQISDNTIYFKRPIPGEQRYELRGKFNKLQVANESNYNGVLDLVIIEQFSNSIRNYKLPFNGVDLTLPETLPLALNDLSNMFQHAYSFNSNITMWNTGHVTDMTDMFNYAQKFNQDLSGWDVSNVTSMERMFKNATAFNQDLNTWDTGSLVNVSSMFESAEIFNGNISNWDTRELVHARAMFQNANAFNQDISRWQMGRVVDTAAMFYSAELFNQDLSGWNMGSVLDMNAMFYRAMTFNQDLSNWCVSKITAEPYNFASGVDTWTLPKPVWGSCPINLNPKGPDLITKVNLDWEPVSDTMKFNTVGITGSGFESVFKLVINDPDGEWALTDSDTGEVCADSTGVIAAGVYVNNYTTSISIECMRAGATIRSYDVSGKMRQVTLTSTANKDAANNTRFNVTHYSRHIAEVRIASTHTKLTIPAQLPEHFTKLDNFIKSSSNFNQDVTNWNTSNITSMTYLFSYMTSFNQDIGNWDVSKVTNFSNMFLYTDTFNQDLSRWDVSGRPLTGNGMGNGSPDWLLEYKPKWGLQPNRNYVKVDITGASGIYITLSKNDGPYVTFDLTDPDFDMVEFSNFLVLDGSGDGIAFFDYPGILPIEQQAGILGTTLCGLNNQGLVVTPTHENGYLPPGFIIGSSTFNAPYTYVNVSTKLTVKHTPRVNSNQDIFYSIPGAVFNQPITMTSAKAISLLN